MVEGSKETTALITEINRATKAQADAISQITMGLGQITGVVLQNSATSEESASASEELSDQARMLKKLVGHFKLKRITTLEAESKF